MNFPYAHLLVEIGSSGIGESFTIVLAVSLKLSVLTNDCSCPCKETILCTGWGKEGLQ